MKIWNHEQNFAITMCIEVNCEPFGLTTDTTPIKVDIVAFRGTSSFGELAQDLTSILTAPFILKKSNKDIGHVSMGLQDAYINLRDLDGEESLTEYLSGKAMQRDRKVIITGHSLGGAMATLLAVELKMDYPLLDIACVTFGAPRVLSYPVAVAVNKLQFYYVRFTNEGDVIPTLPPKLIKNEHGFMHCGKSAIYSEPKGYSTWTVTAVGDFINDVKNFDLLNHSLAGDNGYFNRIVRILKTQIPKGLDPNHPKINPRLPFAEEVIDAVVCSWDFCVNCTK